MILLLIIGIALFLIVRNVRKKQEESVSAETVNTNLVTSGAMRPVGTVQMVPQTNPVVANTGVTGVQMQRKACKQTCKGICGRKPLIAIGKKAKAKKAAWESCNAECEADVCGW